MKKNDPQEIAMIRICNFIEIKKNVSADTIFKVRIIFNILIKKTFLILIPLLFLSFSKNISLTNIYGYNNSILIAQIKNATADRVAYAGFESLDNNGYWSYSSSPSAIGGSITDPGRTGIKYYNLSSGNITRSSLPAGNYFISFWSTGIVNVSGSNYNIIRQKNGTAINGWTYYEFLVNLSASNSTITLSGSNPIKIDEVRLFPENAQMLTYTYDPVIGITSETDINNITLYYIYDEFNRLRYIKDHRGNITKRYTYNFKH